ncbi:hypothetical protein [Amphritea pacifica]|uniref:DUF3592 domain-containing protein n=1 Tax=Amphritea pacifica TaxID=2811233 RepID=A0ABS2WEC2_9GAMM|nr:hypothetical protein [Amphritea pacifica]MBN0989901.1 hypothetical protein [Amphritea pacifica]
MWFSLGIISLISFTLFFNYKKINTSWKGEYSTIDGATYKFKMLRSKHKITGLLVGINANKEYDYTFKRESLFDKFCKSIGLVVEYQVGNSKFDDLVFIISDNVSLHETLSKRTELISTVLDIFSSVDGYTFTVEKIRHNSGCLWVKLETNSEFDETDVKSLTPILVSLLEKLSTDVELTTGQSKQSWKDPYKYKTAVLLGCSTALAITGFILLQQINLSDRPFVIDENVLLGHTLIVGGVSLILLIALTLYLLGKSPRTHRVLLEVLLLGGVGSFLTSYAELNHFNYAFDKSDPQVYEVIVLDKIKTSTRKSTHYYLYTKDWLNLGSKQKIRVPYNTYSKASVGGELVICQKSGALGYRWLNKIIVTQIQSLQERSLQVFCRKGLDPEVLEGINQKNIESLNALYRKMDIKKNN